MSHFAVMVLTETGDESEVERLLAPYDEDGEWFADGSRWDWWVIGGRWTGMLEADYDPAKDPENIETCRLCKGTGKRTDMNVPNGCNGCQGTGKSLKWPTDWKDRGNVLPVKELVKLDPLPTTFALVTPDGEWQEQGRMGWFGATIEDEQGDESKPEQTWEAIYKAALEQYPDAIAVVVDCHV